MSQKTFRRIVPKYPQRPSLIVGHPNNWRLFAESRRVFLERLPRLVRLANGVYNRTVPDTIPNDRVVLSLGVLCWEDFEEILVLGMNGYGFGCQKILRGMFERLVVLSHLHHNPDDTDRFLDFHHISDYKVVREIFESLGEGYAGITKEVVDQRKKARDAVKAKFVRKCGTKDCDKELPAISWSNLDLVSMAKASNNLKDLVGIAYYVPMAHTHASVQSVLSHMSSEGPGLSKGAEKSREWADRVICAANNLVLQSLDLQLEHFLDLKKQYEAALSDCAKDFVAAWGKQADDIKEAPQPKGDEASTDS